MATPLTPGARDGQPRPGNRAVGDGQRAGDPQIGEQRRGIGPDAARPAPRSPSTGTTSGVATTTWPAARKPVKPVVPHANAGLVSV